MTEEQSVAEIQNEAAYEDLIVTIEASQSTFALLICVCDDVQFQKEIIARYKAELEPEIRCYERPILRGEPSLRRTIAQIVESDDYLQAGGQAVVTVTGTEQLFFLKLGEARSEQEVFFGYLQWTREALRDFRFPIVLWVTTQFLIELSKSAPDFWSWRKGVFRFVSHKTALVRNRDIFYLRPALADLDLPDEGNFLLPIADLQALTAHTKQRNPKDPSLATLYAELGKIFANRLRRGEALNYREEESIAIKYLQKAIELQKESGQELELSISLDRLATLYQEQGYYSEAEPLFCTGTRTSSATLRRRASTCGEQPQQSSIALLLSRPL